ncbi:macrophage mannose receptor 1-like, partial [Clarias magur]
KFSGTNKFIGIASPLMSWFEARDYCRTHYTDLASSLSSSDNNMIGIAKNMLGDCWIGLYRDTWKWTDGTNASDLLWYSGQPDNYYGNENCAVVLHGQFFDVPCIQTYYFFCHT